MSESVFPEWATAVVCVDGKLVSIDPVSATEHDEFIDFRSNGAPRRVFIERIEYFIGRP